MTSEFNVYKNDFAVNTKMAFHQKKGFFVVIFPQIE